MTLEELLEEISPDNTFEMNNNYDVKVETDCDGSVEALDIGSVRFDHQANRITLITS